MFVLFESITSYSVFIFTESSNIIEFITRCLPFYFNANQTQQFNRSSFCWAPLFNLGLHSRVSPETIRFQPGAQRETDFWMNSQLRSVQFILLLWSHCSNVVPIEHKIIRVMCNRWAVLLYMSLHKHTSEMFFCSVSHFCSELFKCCCLFRNI